MVRIKSILILFFLLPTFLAIGQNISSTKLYGNVFDSNGKPLRSVHVINLTDTMGTITNKKGLFVLNVFQNDTIKFTSVGYRTTYFIVPFIDLKTYIEDFVLFSDTINLTETIIYPYPATVKAFKEEFLALPLEEEKPLFDLNLEYADIAPAPQTGMIIKGPFTALYEAFSRSAKIRKKYEELVRKDNLKILSSKVYNKNLISRITQLSSDDEIIKFMEFCDLEPEYVIQASKYELYFQINKCYREFNKQKNH